ncbi:MAG TPA: hypothetical protein VG711_06265 [Phycisphaerales bacterium]|nr:hypothetical protein [Phycisphaerales bacterium]
MNRILWVTTVSVAFCGWSSAAVARDIQVISSHRYVIARIENSGGPEDYFQTDGLELFNTSASASFLTVNTAFAAQNSMISNDGIVGFQQAQAVNGSAPPNSLFSIAESAWDMTFQVTTANAFTFDATFTTVNQNSVLSPSQFTLTGTGLSIHQDLGFIPGVVTRHETGVLQPGVVYTLHSRMFAQMIAGDPAHTVTADYSIAFTPIPSAGVLPLLALGSLVRRRRR